MKHIFGVLVRAFQGCFGWGGKTHLECVHSIPWNGLLDCIQRTAAEAWALLCISFPQLWRQHAQPPHWQTCSMPSHLTDMHAAWPATSLTCMQDDQDQSPHWHTCIMSSHLASSPSLPWWTELPWTVSKGTLSPPEAAFIVFFFTRKVTNQDPTYWPLVSSSLALLFAIFLGVQSLQGRPWFRIFFFSSSLSQSFMDVKLRKIRGKSSPGCGGSYL